MNASSSNICPAQGNEAGGHGWRFASTLSFVPEAVDFVGTLCRQLGLPHIPVLAAGGISDPRQVSNCDFAPLFAACRTAARHAAQGLTGAQAGGLCKHCAINPQP